MQAKKVNQNTEVLKNIVSTLDLMEHNNQQMQNTYLSEYIGNIHQILSSRNF